MTIVLTGRPRQEGTVDVMIIGDVTEARIATLAGDKPGQGRHMAESDVIEVVVLDSGTQMMKRVCP